MITVQLSDSSFWDMKADGYLFLLKQDFVFDDDLQKVENEFYPNLLAVLKRHKFTGKREQCFVLTGSRAGSLIQFIFLGLGKCDQKWHNELEYVRRVVGLAIQKLKKLEVKKAVLRLPNHDLFKITASEIAKQITVAANLADYQFTIFKTEGKNVVWDGILVLGVDDCSQDLVQGVQEGTIIGIATNEARHISDLPPNIATPTYLSNRTERMAEKYNLKCTVFGREKAEELGMGGFCEVDVGSDQDGKCIILEYESSDSQATTIALVGKGVTFDTGGVSLKPSNAMKAMKYDMAGAAAVINAMCAIAQLKPAINVVGITPMVENMPSGKSSKQDDIITFMNGKTAEIENTDAEGRLILADALCYAEKFYQPSIIIDIATLTGSCMVALGHFFTGLMTRDDELQQQLSECGMLSGDRVWPLPLDEDYKKAIESDVADVSNSGEARYRAGAITAGWFLSHFVERARWAHLDIAGTANSVPDLAYLGKGATGAGLRLLVEFVTRYARSLKK